MNKHYSFFSNRKAFRVPTDGLLAYFKPDGMVINAAGDTVTGWRNEATGNVVAGGGYYVPADPGFNGLDSMRVNETFPYESRLAGVDTVGYPDGITVTTVSRIEPSTDGSMWWYASDVLGRAFDLWQGAGKSIGLNGFRSECYGPTYPDYVGALALITTTIPANYFTGAQVYLNGARQEMPGYLNVPASLPLSVHVSFTQVAAAQRYSFNGRHSSMLLYNRILPSSELQTLHAYLKQQYAIS